MIDRKWLLILPALTLGLALNGCTKTDSTTDSSSSTQSSDHDHDHDDHDHDDHDHDDHDHDDHDHSDVVSQNIEIADSVLKVDMSGDIEPNAELHVEITKVNGTTPEAIRLWVGTQSGDGSLKTKADDEGDHWHAHVECPRTTTGKIALWIEVEDANGKRIAKDVPLS